MKSIYLILHNIKKLILHNKVTFWVVVFSLIVSTFGILFYSGYIYNISSERRIGVGESIQVNLVDSVSLSSINEIISKIEKEQDIQSILVAQTEPKQQDGQYPIVGEYNILYQERMLSGEYFNRNETEPVLILPEYSVGDLIGYNTSPIKKILKVGDIDYTVNGVISFLSTDYLVVPIEYYLQNLHTRYINITSTLAFNNKDEIVGFLNNNSLVESYSITTPKPIMQSTSFWLDFGQVFLIFIAVIINLFTIIYFWIMRSRKTYNIYSICGSRRVQVYGLIIGQSIVIITSSIATGSLMFLALTPFLAGVNLIVTGVPMFYVLIVALILLITYIFTAVVSLKANKENEIYHVEE